MAATISRAGARLATGLGLGLPLLAVSGPVHRAAADAMTVALLDSLVVGAPRQVRGLDQGGANTGRKEKHRNRKKIVFQTV